MKKKNTLGDYYNLKGTTGYMVYTTSGWIQVDNWKELKEELNEIQSLVNSK